MARNNKNQIKITPFALYTYMRKIKNNYLNNNKKRFSKQIGHTR